MLKMSLMNAIFFHFDCTVIYGKQCPCTVLLNDEMYAKFTYPLRDYLSLSRDLNRNSSRNKNETMFGSGYENCPELGGVIFKLDIL
jgi:hypothetical protein